MRIESQETIQLLTFVDRPVNQLRKIIHLSFLLFLQIAKPAGGFDSANLTADISLKVIDPPVITQAPVPPKITQDIIEISPTPIQDISVNTEGFAVFECVIRATFAATAVWRW